MSDYSIFSSESVAEGHPDKLADQISDTVLDAILKEDSQARVAVETLVKDNLLVTAGEINTSADLEKIHLEQQIRQRIVEIGYDDEAVGFDGNTCKWINAIGKQSSDISDIVESKAGKSLGAGDQGMMFGYATVETPTFMPAPIMYAHQLMQQQAKLRHNKTLQWLRPDAKSQIGVRYDNSQVISIDSVILSTQHHPDVSQNTLREAVMQEIIKPILDPTGLTHKNTKYHINATGRFEIGGPKGDCGLTGRKIIVDTYGGAAHHGGGAFSGKDSSKVDRSAAYAARYIAKNIIAAGLAQRCEIQIAYVIGRSDPVTIGINTYGGAIVPDDEIRKAIIENFDLSVAGIIDMLDLTKPIFSKTASYGHFGREDYEFNWEKTDKVKALQSI